MQTVAQPLKTPLQQQSLPQQAAAFLQDCVGEWLSQRHFYTLSEGVFQETESRLVVRALSWESAELQHLAQFHRLPTDGVIGFGTQVTWESTYRNSDRKPTSGSTIFGVYGNLLLRDRGYETSEPVTAAFTLPKARTLCLHTEYDGCKVEEEIKLIGDQYRMRQILISRAGQETMIVQCLEKRI